MRYTKSHDFRSRPKKQWEYPSDFAKASVQSILGLALVGSVSIVTLVFAELVAEPARVEPVIVLWLAVLSLGACWMTRFIYDLSPPRRSQNHSRAQIASESVPPEVARDVRRGFKRCSYDELARIAANADLEDWYRRLVEVELRRRKGQHKGTGDRRRSRVPWARTAESDRARAGRR